MMISEIYIRTYPSINELEGRSTTQLQQLVSTLENDADLLHEETRILEDFIRVQKEKDNSNSTLQGLDGVEDEKDFIAGIATGLEQAGEKRRGGRSTRKSTDSKESAIYISMEDKHVVLAAEQERLKKMRERGHRAADDAKDMIHATMEDATNRVKEIRAEMQYFGREVLEARYEQNPAAVAATGVSLDNIVKYFEDRPATKIQQTKKLRDKCSVIQQQIAKNNQLLKQKDDVGDFHVIDFDQLKIENQQFVERIDQRNLELVDLKGTTTRTIQSLNRYMERLNNLVQDQKQLQKELHGREEFQQRLKTEMEQVQRDGIGCQRKNESLKIQHESVRVPKVDDYIAQKAEMLELEKSAQNWKRKVEISSGQVAVMKQQMLSISKRQKTMDANSAMGRGARNTNNGGIIGRAMTIRR